MTAHMSTTSQQMLTSRVLGYDDGGGGGAEFDGFRVVKHSPWPQFKKER